MLYNRHFLISLLLFCGIFTFISTFNNMKAQAVECKTESFLSKQSSSFINRIHSLIRGRSTEKNSNIEKIKAIAPLLIKKMPWWKSVICSISANAFSFNNYYFKFFLKHVAYGIIGSKRKLIFSLIFNLSALFLVDFIIKQEIPFFCEKMDDQLFFTEMSRISSIVNELCQKNGFPEPKIELMKAFMNNTDPNAFSMASRPQNGIIGMTSSLVEKLDENEIRGVLAHEFAHMKNRDSLLNSIVNFVAMAMGHAGYMLWAGKNHRNSWGAFGASFIVSVVTDLILLAFSRSREYVADKVGVGFTGEPLELANALEKISPERGSFLSELFSDHPSTEKRIARLKEMSKRYEVAKKGEILA